MVLIKIVRKIRSTHLLVKCGPQALSRQPVNGANIAEFWDSSPKRLTCF
jgi:hypothetical protein